MTLNPRALILNERDGYRGRKGYVVRISAACGREDGYAWVAVLIEGGRRIPKVVAVYPGEEMGGDERRRGVRRGGGSPRWEGDHYRGKNTAVATTNNCYLAGGGGCKGGRSGIGEDEGVRPRRREE